MNDQINRQKLIEAVEKEYHRFIDDDRDVAHNRAIYDVLEIIKAQPPADQWIPCSEREPEDPCVYTVEDCSLYTVNKFGSPQRYVWKVLPPMLGTDYRLVAWKPVDPEPYKGVE